MRRGHDRLLLLLLVGLCLAAVPAIAGPLDTAVLRAQILLARAGFSPGVIDGRDGDNFVHALHAFQQVNRLNPGPLDDASWTRLEQYAGSSPAVGQYTIQPQDETGPFAPRIPQDFRQMARLPSLALTSPRQELAARFHMSEGLLAQLNPNADFARPGTAIAVADVRPPQPAMAETAGSGSSAPGPSANDVRRVVVDKRQHAVLAYDARNALVGFYPATIGSREKPAPSGAFRVRSIVFRPDYTYNPRYHFRGQRATRPVRVAPGPNNPVGLVWVGLSLPGYGIHGTPDPDTVGKAQSHGCVRLTNWDAVSLAHRLKRSTPVVFVG